MTALPAPLDRLREAQAAHGAALESGALDRIVHTTAELHLAVRALAAAPATAPRAALIEALAEADAVRARLNCLSDGNQRQFDRLAGLAGAPRVHAYGRGGRLPPAASAR